MKRLFTFLALLSFPFYVFSQCGPTGEVIINEIHYNPATPDEEEEFIEILNTNSNAIDVSGWQISDGEFTYTFPSGTILGPGEFYVIENGSVMNYPLSNDVFGTTTSQLSNGGEQITLSNATGTIVDDVTYNDTNTWDNNAGNSSCSGTDTDGGGGSLQVFDPCVDNSDANAALNWGGCLPTPGAANSGSPLPVILVSFSAESTDNYVKINWTTATEINNEYFAVQHSTNGVHFEVIAYVEGNGTTTESKEYNYTHFDPSKNINYYRLKQVDYDGAYEYSEIQTVRMSDQGRTAYSVYPTAFTDRLFITSDSSLEGVTVHIFNTQGVLILSSVLQGNEIDLSALASGPYILQIEEQNNLTTQKVIKL